MTGPEQTPHLGVPLEIVMEQKKTIAGMPFDEPRFIARGSLALNIKTGGLWIDTADDLPADDRPNSVENLANYPAAMRIMTYMGDRSIRGFLLDCRFVMKFPLRSDAEEDEFDDSELYDEYDSEVPLGAAFMIGEEERILTAYPNLNIEASMQTLIGFTDAQAHELHASAAQEAAQIERTNRLARTLSIFSRR